LLIVEANESYVAEYLTSIANFAWFECVSVLCATHAKLLKFYAIEQLRLAHHNFKSVKILKGKILI
jgi:hypothetical protein